MNVGMKTEINYKVQVEPAVFNILETIRVDVQQFGISDEEFLRAIWTWADGRLHEYDTPPQWLWVAMEQAQQAREAANTIDGEAGS